MLDFIFNQLFHLLLPHKQITILLVQNYHVVAPVSLILFAHEHPIQEHCCCTKLLASCAVDDVNNTVDIVKIVQDVLFRKVIAVKIDEGIRFGGDLIGGGVVLDWGDSSQLLASCQPHKHLSFPRLPLPNQGNHLFPSFFLPQSKVHQHKHHQHCNRDLTDRYA